MTHEDFMNKSKTKYGDNFLYPSKDWWDNNYKNKKTKIPLVCFIHGEFLSSIDNIFIGSKCNMCNMSEPEKGIYNILTKNKITCLYSHRVKINGINKYFDFFLPDYDLFI